MKLSYLNFLARANIKGDKKNKLIVIVVVLFVLSLTIVSSMSTSVINSVNEYKNDDFSRIFKVGAYDSNITEKEIKQVSEIEHVEDVVMVDGLEFDGFEISDVTGESELKDRLKKGEEGTLWIQPFIGDSKKDVIAGNSLDESPTFSCIISDKFYPFDFPEGVDDFIDKLDYIDGETLIGKTITLKSDSYAINPTKFFSVYNGPIYIENVNIKLKVVGVYHYKSYTSGDPGSIFVSSETAKLIQQQVIENYNGEYKTAIEKWAKNPEQHDYYVVVDSFDNRDLVANEVNNTNVKVARDYICGMDPDMLQIAKLLSMGSIVLLIITTVLTLLIITPITLISVLNRKSEIGLMKAIGYKSRQIFLILYLEQLIKTIRGFIIGGAISSVIIVLINYIINNNSFIDYYMGSFFLVGLEQHLISLGFSLAFAIIVPLICQLITVHKLSKIQPREAMS